MAASLENSHTAPGVFNLAGQEIHVRKSSSYYESLVGLNASFKKAGKSQMKLVPADETFEDEDLLEMVNPGLIPMIVMDSHKAQFWTQIFNKIRVHPEIAVRTGGEIAAAQVIGRETVQYVSNIYKYYIAYKMVTEQREKKQKLIKEKSG